MAMADSTTAENHWTGMGDVSDPAPHACKPVPTRRHRSQARCRSTGPWARCESRRLYRGGAGDPTTRRRGTGSFAGEPFVCIIARLPSQPREDTVNEILIPCPKCRVPGILYLERSIDARIRRLEAHRARAARIDAGEPTHVPADTLGIQTDWPASSQKASLN